MDTLGGVQFAASLSQHPLATQAVGETAGAVLEAFDGEQSDLVVLFASAHHVGVFDDVASAIERLLLPRVLIGATASSVIGAREVEAGPALSVWAARFPDARLTPLALELEQTPDGTAVTGWPVEPVPPDTTLLLLLDPFSFPVDSFLTRLGHDVPGLRVIGGVASAGNRAGTNRLVVDHEIRSDGAVGVLLDGTVDVRAVVSQGCRPIGRPYTVTDAEANVVRELGGRSALERLRELAGDASEEDRALMGRGLHLGLAVDEHRAEFRRGDFLVRRLLGGDERTGSLAVGDHLEVGRTVQFQVRDATAADEDLRELLAGMQADAALLFTCNGRGVHLFGAPDHDAALVETLLGPIPLAGAFCAGEIGPVGSRSFLHGFTASLALFGPG